VKGRSVAPTSAFSRRPHGIDGWYLSALSWTTPGEEAVPHSRASRSQVLSSRRARGVSLGVRLLLEGERSAFRRSHERAARAGTVKTVDARGAVTRSAVSRGLLRASEISRDRVEGRPQPSQEGDSVNAMIINVDRKNRTINLSVKQKDWPTRRGRWPSFRRKRRQRGDQPGRAEGEAGPQATQHCQGPA
jgi:small subunit ribosomal protein S1